MSPNREDQMALRVMAWLDGEATPEEAKEVATLVETHPEWRAMADEMTALIDGTRRAVESARIPSRSWDGYWEEIDRRIATPRRWGWGLIALGGLLLVLVGGFKVFEFATHPLVRSGLVVLVVGFLIIFFAVLRGHLLERPRDPYRKVRR